MQKIGAVSSKRQQMQAPPKDGTSLPMSVASNSSQQKLIWQAPVVLSHQMPSSPK